MRLLEYEVPCLWDLLLDHNSTPDQLLARSLANARVAAIHKVMHAHSVTATAATAGAAHLELLPQSPQLLDCRCQLHLLLLDGCINLLHCAANLLHMHLQGSLAGMQQHQCVHHEP